MSMEHPLSRPVYANDSPAPVALLFLKGNWQGRQSTHVATDAPSDGITGHTQPQIRHPPEQSREGDVPFQACQRCTQTDVNALSKGHMTIEGASDIQFIGVREILLIPVGRNQRDNENIAFLD